MLIFKNICMGFLLFLLIITAYIMEAGFAVVDVSTPDARIWIPLPLAIGHWAGDLVSIPLERQAAWKKIMPYRQAAAEILRQVKDLPDTDFVTVQKANEQVRIYKQGEALYISVDSAREKVQVRLPLAIMQKLIPVLNSPNARVGDLIACLEGQSSGNLIDIQDGDEHVRISLL